MYDEPLECYVRSVYVVGHLQLTQKWLLFSQYHYDREGGGHTCF